MPGWLVLALASGRAGGEAAGRRSPASRGAQMLAAGVWEAARDSVASFAPCALPLWQRSHFWIIVLLGTVAAACACCAFVEGAVLAWLAWRWWGHWRLAPEEEPPAVVRSPRRAPHALGNGDAHLEAARQRARALR